jgi:hypothetical protein
MIDPRHPPDLPDDVTLADIDGPEPDDPEPWTDPYDEEKDRCIDG